MTKGELIDALKDAVSVAERLSDDVEILGVYDKITDEQRNICGISLHVWDGCKFDDDVGKGVEEIKTIAEQEKTSVTVDKNYYGLDVVSVRVGRTVVYTLPRGDGP